ncbi:mCG146540, partial [Mus musculus]
TNSAGNKLTFGIGTRVLVRP